MKNLGQTQHGRSAHELFGLGEKGRDSLMAVREGLAGQAFGVGARQFQRRYRQQVLTEVARSINQLMLTPDSQVRAQYRSPVKDWDSKAWVRVGLHQDAEFEPGKRFFSKELIPIFDIPESIALTADQEAEIMVLWLYQYLDFTVRLEVGPVNYVCARIHDATFLDWLPYQMKDDALKIYTDEGGHAEMSNRLTRRVQEYTAVRPVRTKPQFLIVLDRLKQLRLPFERDLVTLLFVMISETLITGTLSKLPEDPDVQAAVRAVAADHARDERTHHAFFSQLMQSWWPRAPAPVRREAILLLPRLLHAFLDPDKNAVKRMLERYPSAFPHAGSSLNTLLMSNEAERSLQEAARPSLALFKRVGVFEEPGALETFQAAGFVVGGVS